MGSAFLTFQEAANRLGKSKRSIHNYIVKGYLTKVVAEGGHRVRREEVEQLAEELGSDFPVLNRKSIFQLNARLKRAEDELVTIKHILEIRNDPMRPSDKEALGFHVAACDALTRRKWLPQELDLWASTFERMDEVALETFCLAMQNNKAWVPFFNLCTAMMKYCLSVFDSAEGEDAIAWLTRYKKLDEGRKKLRGTVIMWVEIGRGSVPETVLGAMDAGKDVLIRRLSVLKGNSG